MGLEQVLANAKPGQLQAMECLQGPLLISAGAGTGKTFTLTWRMVNALASDDAQAPADVGEVLVITFTNKAAGELVERIRRALADEGLHRDALAMDGAWVSTIHAMCQRILRRDAFALGMDPFFVHLGQSEVAALFGRAYGAVYAELMMDPGFESLFDELGPARLRKEVGSVYQTLKVLPDGGPRPCLGPQPRSATELVVHALERYRLLLGTFTEVAENWKTGTASTAVQAMEQMVDGLERLSHDTELTMDVLAAFLDEVPRPSARGKDEGYLAAMEDELDLRAGIIAETLCNRSYRRQELLCTFAGKVIDEMRRMKDEAGAVDDDDLLVLTHRLLTSNPDIAEEYRERFRLVMVDEFQDTSELQIELIRALCDDESRSLCTVGDEEQSIYAFRGADVAVYRAHRAEVKRNPHHTEASLKENFRSHGDILAAVNTLFSQERMFGDGCLKLVHGRTEKPREVLPGEPELQRVQLMVTEGSKGVNLPQVQAELMAERLRELRDVHGYAAGDMAVLVRGMANADLYSRSLEKRGFSCMVYGGSHYYDYPEVQTLILLLRAIANPYDEEAIVHTLASPLFDVPDEGLLALRLCKQELTTADGLTGYHRVIEVLVERGVLPRELGERWRRIRTAAETRDFARMVQIAFEGSPWQQVLMTGGAGERVCLANILRFCDTVRGMQGAPGSTLRTIIADLEAAKQGEGEKQGAASLAAGHEDAVTIMTIHKSKGLQFPVVVVPDLLGARRKDPDPDMAVMQGGHLHLACWPGLPTSKSKLNDVIRARFQPDTGALSSTEMSVDERSALTHLTSIRSRAVAAAAEEQQRLFYVACTRACEVLVLMARVSKPGLGLDDLAGGGNEGCLADTAAGFFGAEGFPTVHHDRFPLCQPEDLPGLLGEEEGSCSEVPMGRYDHQVVVRGDDGEPDFVLDQDEERPLPETGAETIDAEVAPGAPSPGSGITDQLVPAWDHRGIFSYTALSRFSPHHVEIPPAEGAEADGAAEHDEDEGGSATGFGSAFHLMAQTMAERGVCGMPDEARLDACIHSFHLDAGQAERLRAAVSRWCASDLAHEAFDFPLVSSEMPFHVDIPAAGTSFQLEGSIDLLCRDEATKRALIVDYKTGVTDAYEGEGGLEGRYALQASCYAYVMLRQGFAAIDVVYVRPEVDLDGQPQTIRPLGGTLTTDDLARLEGSIVACWEAFRAQEPTGRR